MALFGRGKAEPISIESEQERLHAIRIAAEQELGRLRRELSERVAAVEQRERELADALTRANSVARGASGYDDAVQHAQVGLAAHAQELNRRERDLTAREQALLRMESDLARRAAAAAETPEERLAHIEERIAALHEAEKAFARTQAELAARSADLASREAALAENARLGVVDAGPVIGVLVDGYGFTAAFIPQSASGDVASPDAQSAPVDPTPAPRRPPQARAAGRQHRRAA